ncbi:MAG TPA: hypothetical protein VI958_10780, partial [Acidobacteriota bacterium]
MFRAFANRILNSLARRLGDADSTASSQPQPPTPQQDADGWGGFTIALEYATSSNNSPRWGSLRAAHHELERMLQQAEERQRHTMDRILQVSNLCAEVAETLEESDPRPRWRNPMMAGLDSCS